MLVTSYVSRERERERERYIYIHIGFRAPQKWSFPHKESETGNSFICVYLGRADAGSGVGFTLICEKSWLGTAFSTVSCMDFFFPAPQWN